MMICPRFVRGVWFSPVITLSGFSEASGRLMNPFRFSISYSKIQVASSSRALSKSVTAAAMFHPAQVSFLEDSIVPIPSDDGNQNFK